MSVPAMPQRLLSSLKDAEARAEGCLPSGAGASRAITEQSVPALPVRGLGSVQSTPLACTKPWGPCSILRPHGPGVMLYL